MYYYYLDVVKFLFTLQGIKIFINIGTFYTMQVPSFKNDSRIKLIDPVQKHETTLFLEF